MLVGETKQFVKGNKANNIEEQSTFQTAISYFKQVFIVWTFVGPFGVLTKLLVSFLSNEG